MAAAIREAQTPVFYSAVPSWRSRASPPCRPGDGGGARHLPAGDAGGERNWDYRYTRIRDSTFALQALHFLNLDWEADEFMQFVARSAALLDPATIDTPCIQWHGG